jgi:hypothetical protein
MITQHSGEEGKYAQYKEKYFPLLPRVSMHGGAAQGGNTIRN